MTNYFKKYIKQDIFKNIQYLDPKCPPKEFKYRENEMTTIASKISPILYGSTPIHAVILGDNATGKTTAIQTLFKEIKETIPEIIPVYINCKEKYTEFKIYSEIYTNILHKTVHRGTSAKILYEHIIQTLQQNHQSLIIALDDINYLLGNDTSIASPVGQEIIRNFSRANERYKINVGLYPIITSKEFKYKFDKEIESVFIPTEITFNPYTEQTLFNIIKERCDYVFYNQINDEIIQLVVNEVKKNNNLRKAWELLKNFGITMKIEEKQPTTQLMQQIIKETL